MANHLRICIVGGRSFGKTALVKAVAQIPCFIVQNNKGAALRLQDMSFDAEGWSQTSWADVKDWRFKFTVEEGGEKKEKVLSFADYAGEYFEEMYEDVSSGSLEHGENRVLNKLLNLLRKIWPWGGHKGDKRRIDKLFYHPDGVIILLPRDFGKEENGKCVYKRSIYECRVLEYLEKLQPGTPVQVVISKWDMNDEEEPQGAAEVEVVASPVFKSCFERILNGYRSRNQKDYDAGIMAISTKEFCEGRWISSNDKDYNEAHNVRALFTNLSRAADVARTERLKADWERAKWWKRFFIMPWRSLGVYRKNSTDGAIKSIFWQSWLRLCAFIGAVAIVTFVAVVSVAGFVEKFRLDGVEADIATANDCLTNGCPSRVTVTKESLAMNDVRLAKNEWTQKLVHPMFFISRLAELKRKQETLKGAYVEYLESDLGDQLNDVRVKDVSPWDESPARRLELASNRLDIVDNQMKRLPNGRTSDKISDKRKEANLFIKHLKEDLAFDQALYDIGRTNENAQLRAMDRARKNFLGKFSYRANDFKKLDIDIQKLEGKLSASLSNSISQLEKEHPANDLQGKTELATLKIAAISNMLDNVFIPGSDIYQSWQNRLSALKQDMANDNLYDPLLNDYDVLNTNDLHDIAKFRAAHPQNRYPKQTLFSSLDSQERNLIQEIANSVAQSETNYVYSDTTNSMLWRIENATSLTNAYVVALGKLRKNDDEYDQLDKKRQSVAEWIVGHMKYITLEDDLNSAMVEAETNKVQALVRFLRKYDNDTYSEYTNRLDAVRNEMKALSAKFVRECTNEIAAARREQSGSWQAKVKDASNRIERINAVLTSVLDDDRPTLNALIKQEEDNIAKWTHYGRFDDEFEKVIRAPNDIFLRKAMKFREEFKEIDFPERRGRYAELTVKETNVVDVVKEAFTNAIAKIPNEVAATNFEGRLERSKKILQANKRALEFIPDGHPASVAYKQRSKSAAEDGDKFATWIMLRNESNRIVAFANAAERKDDEEKWQDIKSLIKQVGGFYGIYPEKDYAQVELLEFYKQVRDSLAKAEAFAWKKYNEETEGIDQGDEIKGGQEKIDNINRHIKLIDNYLSVFLKNSTMYDALLSARGNMEGILSDSEKDVLFQTDYDEINRKMHESISASDKIDAIEDFINKYSSQDWTYKQKVRDAIQCLTKEKSRLNTEKQIEDVKKEVESLIANRPTEYEDDSEKLIVYKEKCSNLHRKLVEIERSGSVQNKVGMEIKKLGDQIKWVEGKMGNGSWPDIKAKETAYKKNPSKVNYGTLLMAVKAFDIKKDGNADHAKGVNDIKEKAEEDRRLAQKVKDAKRDFLSSPNQRQFTALKNAIRAFLANNYRDNNNKFKGDCEIFYDQIFDRNGQERIVNLNWSLQGFDFKDTDYERSTDYSLSFEFNSKQVCEIGDIHGSECDHSWRSYMHYEGWGTSGNINMQPSACLEIVVKHRKGAWRSPNKIERTGLQLIAYGMENNGTGKCVLELKRSTGNRKSKCATITFVFSGLPFLPKEDSE